MTTSLLALLAFVAAADADADVADAAAVDGFAGAEEELFSLEAELVTTASRVAEPLRTAPASITVITRSELDALASATVAEALQGVRGLYQTDDRFYTSLGVRGFNRFGDYGNRLQVQLDGHVMNDDWIFSSYIGNDLVTDIAHVEQIEVVRGPGSALYGTGAFFGIVNLTTPRRAPPHAVRASLTLLDFDSGRVHVDGGHTFENGAGFWLSAGASVRPGRDFSDPSYQGTPWAKDGVAVDVDAYSTASVIGKAYAGDFTLLGSFHERNRRLPTAPFGTAFGDLRNMGIDGRGFLELRYEPQLSETWQLLSRVYVDGQGYEGHYAYTDSAYGLSREAFTSLWSGAEVRARGAVVDGLNVTVGAEAQVHPFNDWFAQDGAADEPYIEQRVTFAYLSAYALGDWRALPWLHLHAGVRFDGWLINVPEGNDPEPAAFMPALNPRVAAIFLPSDDDTIKVMAGRAYRIPSVYELSNQADGFSFSGTDVAGPETIYTGEVEYRRRVTAAIDAVGSVYLNHVSDLLNYVANRENVEGFVNIAEPLWTAGVEAELRYHAPSGLLLSAQYSGQRTRLASLFSDAEAHLGGAHAVVPLAGDALRLGGRAVVDLGRVDRVGAVTDPSVVVDAFLSGHVDAVRCAVGVRNLVGARVEHPVSDRLLPTRLPRWSHAPPRSLGGLLMLRARSPLAVVVGVVVTVVGVAVGVVGCVPFNDRCAGVACGDGEICVDLAAGPRCVCDDLHEESADDGCVPVDDGGSG